MSPFGLTEPELLTFFAVLVRFSTLVAVLPVVGDRFVPAPAKVLFALTVTIALYPALVARGQVNPGEALVWAATPFGIVGTITLEALFGLAMGFVARLLFDAINLGANLASQFMGFAMASAYDPHTESQTQVMAEIQLALAMLVFLVLDGHHLMLHAALSSYGIVGLGKAGISALGSERLIEMSSMTIRMGLQISAPVAVSLFGVQIAFGIISKAMPQVNILILSFAITGMIGLVVLRLGMPEYLGAAGAVTGRVGEWMTAMAQTMGGR